MGSTRYTSSISIAGIEPDLASTFDFFSLHLSQALQTRFRNLLASEDIDLKRGLVRCSLIVDSRALIPIRKATVIRNKQRHSIGTDAIRYLVQEHNGFDTDHRLSQPFWHLSWRECSKPRAP